MENLEQRPLGGGAMNNVIVGGQDIYRLVPTVSASLSDRFAVTGELYHTFAGRNTIGGTPYALGFVAKR